MQILETEHEESVWAKRSKCEVPANQQFTNFPLLTSASLDTMLPKPKSGHQCRQNELQKSSKSDESI